MKEVELCVEIIDAVAMGMTITRACMAFKLPFSKFYKLINASPELAQLYETAKQMRADVAQGECQDIADDDSVPTERAKLRIQTRQWNASKDNPSKFGDRVNLTIDQTINISQALAEAKARVITNTCAPEEMKTVVAELVTED